LKSKGDANCDGKIDEADFNLWKQEFDTMVPASPYNQNANFACVEGNTQTYFVDLVSFEVWRRNTTVGLISYPSPTPTITPVPPTRVPVLPSNTPVPPAAGGGGGGGGYYDACSNDGECGSGNCCIKGGNGNRCRACPPNPYASGAPRGGSCNGPQDCPTCGGVPGGSRACVDHQCICSPP